MKIKLFLIALLMACAFTGKSQETAGEFTKLSMNDLIAKADQFQNKKVEVIGLIVHMCGVDAKKMKLKSPSGAVIKIVPQNPEEAFDTAFKKQLVSVQGVVEVKRIEKAYIDKMEKEGTLLCHIDNTPCKDKEWINKKIETGADVTISKRDIAKLRKKMEVSGKDHITSICIRAEKVELLEN